MESFAAKCFLFSLFLPDLHTRTHTWTHLLLAGATSTSTLIHTQGKNFLFFCVLFFIFFFFS